jgi:hypothetical protein
VREAAKGKAVGLLREGRDCSAVSQLIQLLVCCAAFVLHYTSSPQSRMVCGGPGQYSSVPMSSLWSGDSPSIQARLIKQPRFPPPSMVKTRHKPYTVHRRSISVSCLAHAVQPVHFFYFKHIDACCLTITSTLYKQASCNISFCSYWALHCSKIIYDPPSPPLATGQCCRLNWSPYPLANPILTSRGQCCLLNCHLILWLNLLYPPLCQVLILILWLLVGSPPLFPGQYCLQICLPYPMAGPLLPALASAVCKPVILILWLVPSPLPWPVLYAELSSLSYGWSPSASPG